MKKLVRITLRLLCLVGMITMFIYAPMTLTSETTNPELTHSLIDKIMFLSMIISCGVIYGIFGLSLIKRLSMKRIQYYFLAFTTIFVFGLYYSFMFNSPW